MQDSPQRAAAGSGGARAMPSMRTGAGEEAANEPADAGTDAGCAPAGDVGDIGAAGCALPESTCVDSRTLMFFENPRCDDGRCVSDRKQMTCPQGMCRNGACEINVTAL